MKMIKHIIFIFVGLYIVLAFQIFFIHNLLANRNSLTIQPIGIVSAASNERNSITILDITPTSVPTSTPTPTPTPEPIGDPVSIEIPKLTIKTSVVSVGVTADNTMETPTDFATIGWYSLGVRPGEVGSAIMTGHYDDINGKPAAFYSLSKLKAGDEIFVKTTLGKSIKFIVETSFSEAYSEIPKEFIYTSTDVVGLKLITCDGVWNPLQKTYSKRLVVTARMLTHAN